MVKHALAQATKAASRADWPTCLSALLAQWRATPQAELANLIERVSQAAAGPPVGGAGSATKNVAKRIAAATDADVGPILAFALQQVRTYPAALSFVTELAAARPRDPRIAAALVALIEKPPLVRVVGALQADVVTALDAIDDPRYRTLLVEAWQELEPRRGRIRRARPALDVLKAIALAIPQREPPAQLANLAALLRPIDSALDRGATARRTSMRGADELLAAIHEQPGDPALRLVYADALQIQGNPRGEFIALQCARGDAPPTARERQLLKTHARLWLGEVEPMVLKEGVVYRRGFVACVRQDWKNQTPKRLESPEWSTLEELDVPDRGRHTRFLLDRRWQLLRRVYGMYAPEEIPTLAEAGRTLPWTAIGLRYPDDETWPLVDRMFPDLVELDIADVARPVPALAALGDAQLAKRLRRVRVQTRSSNAGELVAAARDAGLPELELVPKYSFPGAPSGPLIRVAGAHLTLGFHDGTITGRYAAMIVAQLAPKSIGTVSVEARAGAKVDEPSWKALQKVLRMHGVELALPHATAAP